MDFGHACRLVISLPISSKPMPSWRWQLISLFPTSPFISHLKGANALYSDLACSPKHTMLSSSWRGFANRFVRASAECGTVPPFPWGLGRGALTLEQLLKYFQHPSRNWPCHSSEVVWETVRKMTPLNSWEHLPYQNYKSSVKNRVKVNKHTRQINKKRTTTLIKNGSVLP